MARIIRRSRPGTATNGTRTEQSRQPAMSTERRETVTLVVGDLRRFAVALLQGAGVPAGPARSVADGLVAADVEGQPSHGLMLLTMYLDRIKGGSVSTAAQGRIVSDRDGSIVIDAENALGQVTSERAVALAIERAQEHGLAAIAVRNAFHFGAAGRWARMIAEAGSVGIALSNTRPLMPAPGGAERVVGNNPMAIAVPVAGSHPVVVDLALSAGVMGRIRLAEADGQSIPEGWASDADGVPTIDPTQAIRGMLLPAGGPKGFALAAMVDILAGGLSSGAIGNDVRPLYGDPTQPYRCAHLFVAIDIARFRPLAEFGAAIAQFSDGVRTSRPAPGAQAVRMPGDRAETMRVQNAQLCPLARSTLDALLQHAQQLGVSPPPSLTG
jgi:LDH2 family malate/lactate/ureidoglycolate dehydrogenase